MNKEIIKKASSLLQEGNYTLVLYNGKDFITSKARGVRPLLSLYDEGKDVHDYLSADKVIGKGAAFLYVLLNIKGIYAYVISKPALEVLQKAGIEVEYLSLAEHIYNHTHTGFCPIETAVNGIDDPNSSLEVIRKTLKTLKD